MKDKGKEKDKEKDKDRPRLVIAEDHDMVAQGFKVMLGREYDIVEIVNDGKNVVPAVRKHRPDVLLLDLSLPNRTGMDILTELQGTEPPVRVVVVTMHVDPAMVDGAVAAGAAGFVPKDAGVDELKSAIHEVIAGRRYVSRRINRRGPRGHEVDRMGFNQLTPRQQQIVQYIGRGLTSEEIAEELGVSLHGVRFHRRNIARILGLESEWAMVRYAILVGMAAAGPEAE